MKRLRATGWLALALLLPGPSAPAQQASASGSAAISSSQRFVVTGMATADNVALAHEVEQVARKLEQVVGRRLAFGRGQVLGLSIRREEKMARGRVIKAQGIPDGRLEQKLVVVNVELASQEDILEGLCWLLMNRFVIQFQTPEQRSAKLGTVPDWLSTGLAQSLFASLRARNSAVAARLWRQGDGFSCGDLLGLEHLPEGRWSEKAFAASLVDWWLSQNPGAEQWDALFRLRAAQEPVTVEWLGQNGLNLASARDVEKGWDLWLAHQMDIKREWGGLSPEHMESLREALVVRPHQLGVPLDAGAPAQMTLRDLKEHRAEPWMRSLTSLYGLQLQSLGIGLPSDYQNVLKLYVRYLRALARPRSVGFWGRLFWRPASDLQLEALLAQAEKAHADLERTVGERVSYVNEVESSWIGASAGAGERAGSLERSFSRSRLSIYVDEVEWSTAPPPKE